MKLNRRLVAGCLACAALVVCLGQQAYGQGREGGRGEVRAELRGVVKSADTQSITIQIPGGGREQGAAAEEKTFALAKNVEVAVSTSNSGGPRGGGVFREAKVGDLSAGIMVSLLLGADGKTVDSIVAEEPMLRGLLKTIDAKKLSLTVSMASPRGRGEAPADEEKTFTVAADAEIVLDDGRGKRYSFREGKLEDVAGGSFVSLRLSLDKKQVRGLIAEGEMLNGFIKSLDAAKKSLTMTVRPARGDNGAEERSLTVSADATILLDDGKGRRLSVKEAKLADIPVGAMAMVKLSPDQNFVMMLRVEGAMVTGLFKSADADKGVITIALPPKDRGEAPEEKSFTLAKDVRVTLDGAVEKLVNIKAADNGPIVNLRLSLDQKTVQSVQVHQIRGRE